ncbi:MAG: hypothetical protein LBC03_00400 [Nitrososphaerota archaeon]|jgi:biotin operon repressor|nr:hypothetical protein [Nitrososphaerota archaeon]
MTNIKPEKDLTGPLERIFQSITAKILDFLITYQEYDYSKQDIAKYSGVSYPHTLKNLDRLEQQGLIIHTRKSGHSHMYKYNTQNPTATLLNKFIQSLTNDEYKQITANQKPDAPITVVIP